MENIEDNEEKKGFFAWLGSKFSGKDDEEEVEEVPAYKRRLFDGRIEKYLDQNLDSYITEYGIVTELDLQSYEERYSSLTDRVKSMKDFILDSDAMISQMEKEMLEVGSKIKPTKKRS
jgi:hypothetical protein